MKEVNVKSYFKEDGNSYSCRFLNNVFLINSKIDLKYKVDGILGKSVEKINIFYLDTSESGTTKLYKNNKLLMKDTTPSFGITTYYNNL